MDKPLAVFDMDGTLYQTECVSLPAIHSAADDFGLPQAGDATIKSLFGYTTPDLCARLYPDLPSATQTALSDKVRHYERALIATHGRLYDGIPEMLRALRADGWTTALCTNGTEPYVNTILSGLDLWDLLDIVRWKTDESTKTSNLRDIIAVGWDACVMIGDKQLDVDAARDNAIPCIGVSWGYGSRQELGGATFIADTVGDLLRLLARCRNYRRGDR